jgi:tetratricopeptide (TPR) repeat protein/DNA-binding winged helix-turn-helix (wHTH) protein/TolB-like protein
MIFAKKHREGDLEDRLLHGFYLGELLVEPLKGKVSSSKYAARVTPTAMEVLLVLAGRPGDVVPRDDIVTAVWGGANDSPEQLSRAVSDLRHALRDSATDPRFIQTLPRRGYRLIPAPVPANGHESSLVMRHELSLHGVSGLFGSLAQRGVLETGIAYLILGWLLIQVADVVFSQLLLPQWAGTFVTILVIAGFPIALALSWFLEFRDGKAVVDHGSANRSPRQRFSRTYVSVLCALFVASALVYTYDRMIGLPIAPEVGSSLAYTSAELPPVEANSVAVMPFLNIDGSEQTELFANGFAEDLIHRLSLLPGFAVATRRDSWSLGATASSSEVRRRLRVLQYIEGSVEQVGDEIRVNVKLIDSGSGFPIISRTFASPLRDFNQVRRDITDVMLGNLKIASTQETQEMLDSIYDETDLDAYILYRRGREAYERPRTIQSLVEAAELFEQALAYDLDYAPAHAGVCSAHVEIYELSGASENIDKAQQACAAALQSNPRLHMVYSALGDLYLNTGQTQRAKSAYEQSLALNAHNARAIGGLADVYRRLQRFEEAETLLINAIGSQPGNWRAINSLGTFLFSMGRFRESADAYRQIVNMDPQNFEARSNLGSALTMASEFEEGRRVLEESLELRPLEETYSNLGVIYYFLGEFEKSVESHRQAIEMTPDQALPWLNLADSLHFAGQAEASAAAFKRALELSADRLRINPADSQELLTLAWAQHRLGDSRAGLASIERGLELDPGDPYSHYYEALIRYQTGDEVSALAAIRAALENGYPAGMLVAEPYLGELRASDEFHALILASF